MLGEQGGVTGSRPLSQGSGWVGLMASNPFDLLGLDPRAHSQPTEAEGLLASLLPTVGALWAWKLVSHSQDCLQGQNYKA